MNSSLLDKLKALPKKKQEPPVVEVCSLNEQNFIGAQLKDLQEESQIEYGLMGRSSSLLMSSIVSTCMLRGSIVKDQCQWELPQREVRVLYQQMIYILGIDDLETVGDLKKKLSKRIENPNQELVLLYEGKILLDDDKDLADFGIQEDCDIIAIPTSEGGDCLRFMQMVLDTMTKDLEYMKGSLEFLKKKEELEMYISVAEEIIDKARKENLDLKDASEVCLLAIVLWTSPVLYLELNQTFRGNKDFSRWNVYLKHMMSGLKSMPYYRGKAYRGFEQVRDLDAYKDAYKTKQPVNWKTVSALSKKKKVAENFSSKDGMIFEVDVFSSRDISSVSMFSEEEEVLILPYSRLDVINIIETPGEPVYIKLREIPIPRAPKVVFWVDDNPENNLEIAKAVEDKEISCVFAVSTNDALRVINSFQWILLFQDADFRIITDMVRYEKEDGTANYTAGVDLVEKLFDDYQYNFEVLICCGDVEKAQESCNARNLKGRFSITDDFEKVEEFLRFK